MNTQVEKLEDSQVKLTVEIDSDQVTWAIAKAYQDMKKDFNIQGFRKGKVPRAIIEKMYGVEVFFNKAADILIEQTIGKAIEDNNVDIAARIGQEGIEVVEMSKDHMKYEATITVKPEFTLGDYKGLEIEVDKVKVTDEEIDAELEKEADKNSREISITDRPVQDKDTVIIDFKGFVDGQPFEGGSASDYSLVIGSKSFIEGFEEQLIGKSKGEKAELNVTFPENYHLESLAGKPAVFEVEIKDIKVKEVPEINDDFAADVSEFETLSEYKESIREKLLKQKEDQQKVTVENKLIEMAVKNADVKVPKAMTEDQMDKNIRNFEARLNQQGLKLEHYIQFTGQDMAAFRESIRDDAEKQIASRLVLDKIALEENVQISEEELDSELKEIAKYYNMEFEELKKVFPAYEKEALESDLKVKKVIQLIVDSAKVTEKE